MAALAVVERGGRGEGREGGGGRGKGAARQRAGRRKQSGWRPMYFCPHCGNMLQLEVSHMARTRLIAPFLSRSFPQPRPPRTFPTLENSSLPLAIPQNMSGLRFFCQTCPYIHRLAAKVRAAELSRSSYTGISSAILLPAGRV